MQNSSWFSCLLFFCGGEGGVHLWEGLSLKSLPCSYAMSSKLLFFLIFFSTGMQVGEEILLKAKNYWPLETYQGMLSIIVTFLHFFKFLHSKARKPKGDGGCLRSVSFCGCPLIRMVLHGILLVQAECSFPYHYKKMSFQHDCTFSVMLSIFISK